MTVTGFVGILCHEIGHHIGGAPKAKKKKLRHYSIEGQSDYFATTKCMRKLFTDDENTELLASVDLDSYIYRSCREISADTNDLANCLRSGQAAWDLGHLLKAMYRSKRTLDFETPDPTVVSQTLDYHTNPQCRLDTYWQGALCDTPSSENLSQQDPEAGTCWPEEGDAIGARPACWYLHEEKTL